jgi:hypothetical protein
VYRFIIAWLRFRVLPAPPRSPAQFRFPCAVGIVFDFPWLCRERRGIARSLSPGIGGCRRRRASQAFRCLAQLDAGEWRSGRAGCFCVSAMSAAGGGSYGGPASALRTDRRTRRGLTDANDRDGNGGADRSARRGYSSRPKIRNRRARSGGPLLSRRTHAASPGTPATGAVRPAEQLSGITSVSGSAENLAKRCWKDGATLWVSTRENECLVGICFTCEWTGTQRDELKLAQQDHRLSMLPPPWLRRRAFFC